MRDLCPYENNFLFFKMDKVKSREWCERMWKHVPRLLAVACDRAKDPNLLFEIALWRYSFINYDAETRTSTEKLPEELNPAPEWPWDDPYFNDAILFGEPDKEDGDPEALELCAALRDVNLMIEEKEMLRDDFGVDISDWSVIRIIMELMKAAHEREEVETDKLEIDYYFQLIAEYWPRGAPVRPKWYYYPE